MPIKKKNSLEAFLRKEYGDEKGKSYYVNLFAKACKHFGIDREKFKDGGFILDDKNKALILLIMDLYMERESYYKRGPYKDEYHSVDSIIFPINSLIKRANKYSAIENTMNSMVEYKNIQNMLGSQKCVKKIVELFMVLIDDAYGRNTGFATITEKIEELIIAYVGHNISGQLYEQYSSNVHMYDQLGGEFYKADKTQSYSRAVEDFVYELEREVHSPINEKEISSVKMDTNHVGLVKMRKPSYHVELLKKFLYKFFILYYYYCVMKKFDYDEYIIHQNDYSYCFLMRRDKEDIYEKMYNLYHHLINFGYIVASEAMELGYAETIIMHNSMFEGCTNHCNIKMYKCCHKMRVCQQVIRFLLESRVKYDCIQFNIGLLSSFFSINTFDVNIEEDELYNVIEEPVNKAYKLILEMNEKAKKQIKQYEERINESETYSKINQAFGNYVYDNFTRVKK